MCTWPGFVGIYILKKKKTFKVSVAICHVLRICSCLYANISYLCLSSECVYVCVFLAFPVADFNSPGAVERWRVTVWIARAEDGSPGASNISTT